MHGFFENKLIPQTNKIALLLALQNVKGHSYFLYKNVITTQKLFLLKYFTDKIKKLKIQLSQRGWWRYEFLLPNMTSCEKILINNIQKYVI